MGLLSMNLMGIRLEELIGNRWIAKRVSRIFADESLSFVEG